MRNWPVPNRVFQFELFQTLWLLRLQHFDYFQQIVELLDSDQQITSLVIHNNWGGTDFFQAFAYLLYCAFIYVQSQTMAHTVLLLQTQWATHASNSSLNHNTNSICQDISLLHRMRSKDNWTVDFQFFNECPDLLPNFGIQPCCRFV